MRKIYWIDLFCGFGGTSTGIHLVNENVKVIACVNHDEMAIKSHKENHPDCEHFPEDIRDWKVIMKLRDLVKKYREKEPDCIINIWASLECTHFSKAKGGMSRDPDSRTLGDHLIRYIKAIKPDYLYIENVIDFLSWGPTRQVSKIINGSKMWKYQNEKKEIFWLEEKYSKMAKRKSFLQKKLKPFELAIKEKKKIFYNRWIDHNSKQGYHYNYEKLNAADFGAYTSRDRYFGIFAKEGLPIVFPEQTYIKKGLDNPKNLPHWKPVRDVLNLEEEGVSVLGLNSKNKPFSENTLKRVYHGLKKFHKQGVFMKRYNGGKVDPESKSKSADEPLGTILSNNTHAVVKPVFLTSYYGNGTSHSVDDPCNTLTTKERYAMHFINYDYSNPTHSSLDAPAGSVTTNPKHNLITAKWLMDTQFSNIGRSVDRPCPTIIARMDKKPLYLISAGSIKDSVNNSVEKPGVRPIERLMRYYMRKNGIADVKIRMLFLEELLEIQGFPKDYIMRGTKTNKLKFIGNSVVPIVAAKLAESNFKSIQNGNNRAS